MYSVMCDKSPTIKIFALTICKCSDITTCPFHNFRNVTFFQLNESCELMFLSIPMTNTVTKLLDST
uniref:Uncharacterized protein n=1 Tax=Octopus bimaculoides TaxID=37653 RepID=A0A0L8HF42_OCTBM